MTDHGPYQINETFPDSGNVEIQIAPSSKLTVKQSNLRLANNQNIDLTDLYKSDLNKPIILKSSKLSEILILTETAKFPKSNTDFKKPKIPDKSQFTIESLVGKRIAVYWTAGNRKNLWFPGLVVGYTNNLTRNLVFYDDRTDDVDPAVDYYAESLLSDSRLKWKLLS